MFTEAYKKAKENNYVKELRIYLMEFEAKREPFEIAEKLGITVSAVNQRIKNLSENIGTINKFIELANTIGYNVDIAFVK